jgi:hypothetical protein
MINAAAPAKVDIKRISYSYNSALEGIGKKPYYLDCFILSDGEVLVDRHEAFNTRDEFYSAIEAVVPMLEGD